MPFTIIRQDITKMKVDAIVNAANTELLMGGGVCGAIFQVAGAKQMQDACDRLAPIQTGEVVITPGFNLYAKYVIHTAGPVYYHKRKEQCALILRKAYLNSLKLAVEHQCASIAFPLISSGIYGYPKVEALEIATSAITDFLLDYELNVYLTVFDKDSFVISEKLIGEVESYIDEHYVHDNESPIRRILDIEKESVLQTEHYAPNTSLEDMVDNLRDPFSTTLLKLIDRKGMSDVEVYKKANLDRKLFSKIRTVKGYTPKKSTILALAIALELSLDETNSLLECAGYALSHSSKFDVIIEYFIVNEKYNIFDINEVLFKYHQPLLGG